MCEIIKLNIVFIFDITIKLEIEHSWTLEIEDDNHSFTYYICLFMVAPIVSWNGNTFVF